MKLSSNTVRFLTFLFFIEFIGSNQFISIFLQKCYGNCNKNYCNISTKCRPLNRTSKMYSMDIYFREGLKLEAPIDVEVTSYKKFRTEYRPLLLKVKYELCEALNRTDHPFTNLIWHLKFDGNFLDPCPISGHRCVKPYVPIYDSIPLVPVGEWKMETILSKTVNNSREMILSWYEFYEVKPTTALEF